MPARRGSFILHLPLASRYSNGPKTTSASSPFELPTADIDRRGPWVAFVPRADMCVAANIGGSFDQSVGSKQERSGIERPIAFAVFRLMVNSSLVGCSIGKSLGCRPCKTLCTNPAPCRNKAGPSAPYDIRPPASTKARVLEAAGKRCSRARSAIRLVDKLP